jgi:glycosyltransferase involved in cell wall biosynthesis
LNGLILKIALVTNTLAPYRNPVFSEIAKNKGIQFVVICCSKMEPNRHWDLPSIDFECLFLQQRIINLHGRYIHNNPDVIKALANFKPDVIVNDGLNPTHLYAFFFARFKKIPHVYMTDGTFISEQSLTSIHQIVRQYVFKKSSAYIAASQGGFDLFEHYQLPKNRFFRSCLCVDNQAYANQTVQEDAAYDLMFCGRLEPVKNPFFVIEVAVKIARKLSRPVSLLFVGEGSLDRQLKEVSSLFPGLIKVTFFGHAQQGQLPHLYHSARLFLFPSFWDPWGVVVNEACASGLPVIASPFAGVSHELVCENQNGYICELDPDLWTEKATDLLTQATLHQSFSQHSLQLVAPYTFKNASEGIVKACEFALNLSHTKPSPMPLKKRPHVLIVERQLLQYRADFYNQLRKTLHAAGIELQLLTGKGTPDEAKKKNEVTLDWSQQIPTHYLPGTSLCWQPFGRYAKKADLVIVMHENKILYNLWLLSLGRPKRLAFWGHGRNMQSGNPRGLKERFKRWTINKVDWWFAYTQSSADLVTEANFPLEKTTVVENAVDTESLSRLCQQFSAQQIQRERQDLQLGNGQVGLYLGSLYKEKRIDFLIEAAIKIRQQLPTFQLLVAGAGPEQSQVEEAQKKYKWIHYLGPVQEHNKAMALVLADVILNPGLVGLGVLDSFASGKPMLTTDCGLHSPEISYLISGVNGLITTNDVDSFANATINVLRDAKALTKLSDGALSSAENYTIANMVNRIHTGIVACLNT